MAISNNTTCEVSKFNWHCARAKNNSMKEAKAQAEKFKAEAEYITRNIAVKKTDEIVNQAFKSFISELTEKYKSTRFMDAINLASKNPSVQFPHDFDLEIRSILYTPRPIIREEADSSPEDPEKILDELLLLFKSSSPAKKSEQPTQPSSESSMHSLSGKKC